MALFFFEAKKMGTAPSLMTQVENQAWRACRAYLADNKNIGFIYAVTTIGTEARIWKYDRITHEESLTGNEPKGVRTAYIDAASPDSSLLRTALLAMKENPPTPIEPVA
ncbi:hypothetical protein GMOD_00009866 [Pyrenophora seminiperda CCB06]|uniref:Uncharacterized protein n=1 Tax=Pyrenophora seminiperda CCB06 TaxID=1302712 RepID=A0A3M7ME53_9PLEO|nr:hypothetical protein GMOD_00009866 [Pyrenophora seminiperda CCB06]